MGSFLGDIRFGARILLRSPGTTIWVIVALALGIGANTAMFSVVDALLIHPVHYRDPGKLVLIWERDAEGAFHGASAAYFLDWRAQSQSFSSIAGWAGASYILRSADRSEQVAGATVTSNFFPTLGVQPLLGRTFLPGEDGVENSAG